MKKTTLEIGIVRVPQSYIRRNEAFTSKLGNDHFKNQNSQLQGFIQFNWKRMKHLQQKRTTSKIGIMKVLQSYTKKE